PVKISVQLAAMPCAFSSLSPTQLWMACGNRLVNVGDLASLTDCPLAPSTMSNSTFGAPYTTSTSSSSFCDGIVLENSSLQLAKRQTVNIAMNRSFTPFTKLFVFINPFFIQ